MFSFTDYIDVRAFFISLFIGIMIAYVLAPHKKYIIAYPTPENAHEKVYHDNDFSSKSLDLSDPSKDGFKKDEKKDSCVKYESKEVSCPQDSSMIQQTGMTAPTTDEKDVIMKTLRTVLKHDS
jgi:hypothetical protein